jgi:hypothetical protein
MNITYRNGMQSDFDDINFYNGSCWNENGANLSAELEYKTDNITAWAWVRMNLTTGNNTVAMYYGNNTLTSQWDTTGKVWDANFTGVWHKNSTDSTTYANTGEDRLMTYGTGIFGKSFTTGLSNGSYAIINDADSLDFGSVATWEMVVKENVYTSGGAIIDKYNSTNNREYRILTSGGNDFQLTLSQIGTTGGSNTSTNDSGLFSGQWAYLAIVYNGTENKWYAYKNGTYREWKGTNYTSLFASSSPLFFGWQQGSTTYFNGSYDEVRFSNKHRTANWINLTYQLLFNQAQYVIIPTGGAPPSNTCTWVSGADWVMTDYCNITSPVDVCPYRLIVNGSGKLNISNGAVINASLFQFSIATTNWRVSINSGGLKNC